MADLAKSLRPVKSHGQIAPGNIDLYNRPSIPNPVGGDSTVYSASFNIDGQEVLLPLADEGRILTKDEAVQKYLATGKHLGTFNDPASATQYAGQLHDDYARGRYDMRPAVSHPPLVRSKLAPIILKKEREYQNWLQARGVRPQEQEVYDYRSAMMAGEERDKSGHWSSDYKYDFTNDPSMAGTGRRTHPDIVVGGFHTKTLQRVPTAPLAGSVEELIILGWEPKTAQHLWNTVTKKAMKTP